MVASLRLLARDFAATFAVLLPVGITVADEVGMPAVVCGVSMRVSYTQLYLGFYLLHTFYIAYL